jgi:hypothetical protein
LVRSMAGTYRSSWPAVIGPVRWPRGPIEAQNGGRRVWRSQGGAHLRLGGREMAGFWRTQDDGDGGLQVCSFQSPTTCAARASIGWHIR